LLSTEPFVSSTAAGTQQLQGLLVRMPALPASLHIRQREVRT
jgi:hypothetical protein